MPDAREIECAVLGNDDAGGVGRQARSCRRVSSTTTKRSTSTARSRLEIPAALDAGIARRRSQRQAIVAFEAIDGAGLARVDFLLSRSTGDLFVNEINTLPGFTTISMYAKLWAASGVDYAALVDRLIALAIERHTAKQQLQDQRVLTRLGTCHF